MYTHASGEVAERSKAPVLKTVPIQIQQTTQTNTTVNMRPRGRSGLLRLSSTMEFAKNPGTIREKIQLRLRVFLDLNHGR